MDQLLSALLEQSSARHDHLCPRQILGVRVGLAGAAALGIEVPIDDKSLLVILETDGCFADGVEVATGCTIGHRTLRVEDFGKTAATFVNVATGEALRVAPAANVRQLAYEYVPDEPRHYFAQLSAYQIMPAEELLLTQSVELIRPVAAIVSRAGVRVNCAACGEEIINEREVLSGDQTLCKPCAGDGYYVVDSAIEAEPLSILE